MRIVVGIGIKSTGMGGNGNFVFKEIAAPYLILVTFIVIYK